MDLDMAEGGLKWQLIDAICELSDPRNGWVLGMVWSSAHRDRFDRFLATQGRTRH
ncbi:MAG TPA: hypothetical protein VK765_06135 [Solirubrobacteraceae bacterium]|nr:hypothetical protein [Solirubrobacteraceae bacterium]